MGYCFAIPLLKYKTLAVPVCNICRDRRNNITVRRCNIALTIQENNLLQEIKIETGIDVQLMAARSVAKVFDKLGLPYERTAKSQAPSFTKNFISNHEHPVVRKMK